MLSVGEALPAVLSRRYEIESPTFSNIIPALSPHPDMHITDNAETSAAIILFFILSTF